MKRLLQSTRRYARLAVLIAMALLALAAWRYREAAAADLGAVVADAAWLTSALPRLLRRAEPAGPERAPLPDVMAALSETLPHHAIAVERVEPDGNGRLHVWFGPTEFAAVVNWLWHLEAELGLRVEALQTSALAQPGSVRGSLVAAAEGAPSQ